MIILASQSPRRKELLAELVPTFSVVPADIDESVRIGEAPLAYVARMAAEKAAVVLPNHPNDLVIASDTTVTINGEILGKPVDRQDAYRMLRLMSGKKHWVHTAVYLQKGDQQCQAVVSAEVTFSPLTDEMIHRYLDLGEYADKAGAYGIQGAAKVFVEAINGDYYAIVGFPVNTVHRMLTAFSAPF